jgi:hypothetical protein
MNIRFIRYNEKYAKNDDTMKIISSDGENYDVVFTQGETKKSTLVSMSDSAVFRWVRHTISLLARDADPFEFVQLDLPLMPSVMVKVKELDSAYNTILNAVEFHLDNWPIKPRTSEANTSLPVNTAFCCDHEDEDEEEDYDDMPPLIPIDEPQQFRTHHMFLD